MSTIYEQPITGKSQGQDVAVTYYTLRSEYPNDFTKNCSLLSSEIDGNFYFLRGYDIKSFNIDVDENGTKRLYLERLNGERLEGDILSDDITDGFKFEFNEEDGVITITYPNGKTVELKRFNTIRAATNGTIKGDGSIDNPLRLSEVETTGTYSPAKELVEIPKDDVMPDGTKLGKGYRIVTKEYVTKFGRLYNYNEVKEIADQLKETNSPWRIPTKEDWDEMLNAIEPCNDGRNHESKGSGYYGKDAGALLKQAGNMSDKTGLWNKPSNDEDLGEDKYGFEAIPVGFSGPRGDFLKPDDDNDIEGYHLSTAFWTSTPAGLVNAGNEEDAVYAKALYYKSRKVNQQVLSKESKLSLRLVKDFSRDNMSMFDDILGYWYPCTHIIANQSKYWYSEIDELPEDAEAYAYDEIPQGDDIILNEKYIKVGKRYYELTERKYHHNKIWTAWNIGTNAFGYKSDQWNDGYYKEIDEYDVPESSDVHILDEIPTNPIIGKNYEYILVNGVTYQLVDYGVYSVRYFINEWDGEKWVKKMMKEGDSVAIINGPDGIVNHEWRVFKKDEVNDILVDVVAQIKDEIKKDLTEYVDGEISKLKEYVDQQDEKVLESAKAYADEGDAKTLESAKNYADEGDAKTLAAAKEYTNGEITKVNNRIDEEVEKLNTKIDTEVTRLDEKIDQEIQDRKDADEAEATERFNNDIAKASYTIGGGDNDAIEIKNNAEETVVTLMFDGNFGEI